MVVFGLDKDILFKSVVGHWDTDFFFLFEKFVKSLQVNLFLADLTHLKTIVRVRALIFHSSHGPLPGSNKEIPSTSFYSVAI